jgi:hypothetical protein
MMRMLSASLTLRVRSTADPMTRDVVLLVTSAHRQRPVDAFLGTAHEVAGRLPSSFADD